MVYKLDGKTSNASIHYYLENFKEKKNTKRNLIGEMGNYNIADTKVDIEMKTSNGSIILD
ncbi:MAG: hypothetical protein GX947_00820 [Tissierellia bacterium]|nr:hypothetical protein [Tissierellia bacterium]